MTRTLFCRDPF